MLTIEARIYDTDGTPWAEEDFPALRGEEGVPEYALRLQKWARRQILDASDSYNDCTRVECVDSHLDAHVVVRVENEYEVVEYYLCCE